MNRGLFIVFEGLEGCGKTTQLQLLYDNLVRCERRVVVTRDPGGTIIGDHIRKILLSSSTKNLSELSELLLYEASRAQLLYEIIIPTLQQGSIVLCDRFIDSSTAYQGYARGLGIDFVEEMNDSVVQGEYPDLTFYLDIPIEIGLQRARKRNTTLMNDENRFEEEELDFHRKLRDAYYQIRERKDYRIINSDRDPDVIAQEIFDHVITYENTTDIRSK